MEQTTLADIAERAGVAVGNVYYYFKTKDALFDAFTGFQERLYTPAQLLS